MPDYQLSKIYKLVSNHTDEIYIGSTCQSLAKRKGGHISDYKLFIKGGRHSVTSFKLIELGDIDIVLIEECPCDNKDQLHARERFYIESNDCVNKIIPGRTLKEYYQENKEIRKEYIETNKDKIKEYQKEYCDNNKEKIKEKHKEYRELNKDKIKENRDNNKEYYHKYKETNKEKIKAQSAIKYTCECGGKYQHQNKLRHFKCKKHTDHISTTSDSSSD